MTRPAWRLESRKAGDVEQTRPQSMNYSHTYRHPPSSRLDNV